MTSSCLLISPDVVDVLDHVQDSDVPLLALVTEVAGEEVDHNHAPDLQHPLEDVVRDVARVGAHGARPRVREDHGGQGRVHHLEEIMTSQNDMTLTSIRILAISYSLKLIVHHLSHDVAGYVGQVH